MTALLKIDDLSGGYGKLVVFRGVSFAIEFGKTLGLLGPNGAGKTTLLKTIVGVLPALSGSVFLAAQDVTAAPAFKRARAGIGLVPEGRQILGTLSVLDNLMLTRAGALSRGTDADFCRRLQEVYEYFPRLHERRGQLAGSLSGGEQQMLAIGRALLIEPKVLMLDEPTQGLAPIIVQDLANKLNQLKGRFAILLVEQNRSFLQEITDAVMEMRGGELVR